MLAEQRPTEGLRRMGCALPSNCNCAISHQGLSGGDNLSTLWPAFVTARAAQLGSWPVLFHLPQSAARLFSPWSFCREA